jgi:hypothetical protein
MRFGLDFKGMDYHKFRKFQLLLKSFDKFLNFALKIKNTSLVNKRVTQKCATSVNE